MVAKFQIVAEIMDKFRHFFYNFCHFFSFFSVNCCHFFSFFCSKVSGQPVVTDIDHMQPIKPSDRFYIVSEKHKTFQNYCFYFAVSFFFRAAQIVFTFFILLYYSIFEKRRI